MTAGLLLGVCSSWMWQWLRANMQEQKFHCISLADKKLANLKTNLKKSLSSSKTFVALQNLAIKILELTSLRKEEYYNNFSNKP